MVQENEIIMLLLGIGFLTFIVTNRKKVKRIPESNTIIFSFYILMLAHVLTILEGLFWNEFLNLMEHICYAVSSILLTLWCWKIFSQKVDTP
jgi:hypothetical protein